MWKITKVKYPITSKDILKKSPRRGLSVCDRLRGHRDACGGPNHLEKRGLRGSGHTYWEMTENIWDHSQTHMYSNTPKIFTHILRETHAIKLISNPGSNCDRMHLRKVWCCAVFVILARVTETWDTRVLGFSLQPGLHLSVLVPPHWLDEL